MEPPATSISFLSHLLLLLVCLIPIGCREQSPVAMADCRPTPHDSLGPFYRPDAPVRQSVGEGYVLIGAVLSAGDCRPLPKARIEFWLVNPQGDYDDAHRATVFADDQGKYRFESNRPTGYGRRPPHIHIKVTAEGHEQLITQHYPQGNATEAVFDLVLVPMSTR